MGGLGLLSPETLMDALRSVLTASRSKYAITGATELVPESENTPLVGSLTTGREPKLKSKSDLKEGCKLR